MDRQCLVQKRIGQLLVGVADLHERGYGYIHLFGVSTFAAMLAMRRGLNVELAGVAGLLHDIATYTSGSSEDHARRSAEQARLILDDMAVFTAEEVDVMCTAIANHSDKSEVHDAFSELLKDADVLHHSLYAATIINPAVRLPRIEALCVELSLAWPGMTAL